MYKYVCAEKFCVCYIEFEEKAACEQAYNKVNFEWITSVNCSKLRN